MKLTTNGPAWRRAGVPASVALLVSAAVAAVVVGSGSGSVAATGDGPATHSVTVSGTGMVGGIPDVLRLEIGVQRTGQNVSAALNAANEDIRKIKASLERHGVAAKDIQTSQLSINPHYDPYYYEGKGGPATSDPAPAPAPAPDAPDAPVAPEPPKSSEQSEAPAAAPEPAVAPMPEPMTKPMSEPAVDEDRAAADPAPQAGSSSGSSGSGSTGSTGTDSANATTTVAEPVPMPVPPPSDVAVLGTPAGISARPPGGTNGFDVYQSLSVRLRNLPDAGKAISDAAEAGGDATRINGISFEIENSEALLKQARDAAFADAKAKAEQYARLAGRDLGRVVQISENNNGSAPIPYAGGRAEAAMDSSVPIQPGTQQVSVASTVVWELN